MTVICQLHEEAGWLLSVSYMGQVGGYHSATRGRLAVFCQIHQAGFRLYVSYLRQIVGYLSVIRGRWTLYASYMRQDDDYLSVT